MLKRFLRSNRGNAVIIMILLLPTLIFIFANTTVAKRRENVLKTETSISIDNFTKFVNNKYGIELFPVPENKDKGVCSYPAASKEKIKTLFSEYYKNIDGYNYHWKYDIEFKTENTTIGAEALTTEYFVINCTLYYPKIANRGVVVNYWGNFYRGANGIDFKGTPDAYYVSHNAEIVELENYFEEGVDSKYWEMRKLKVVATCA